MRHKDQSGEAVCNVDWCAGVQCMQWLATKVSICRYEDRHGYLSSSSNTGELYPCYEVLLQIPTLCLGGNMISFQIWLILQC